MAVQATAQWWVRTDGDNTNGGGYDSGISGAGTNYSDQASAQLSLTDLATASAGSTTLTSATGGFTAAMIGNAIQIVSGTNSVPNSFYFITAYTDTNTVTIDRASDNGSGGLSGGSGKLGGAVAGLEKFSSRSAHNPNTPLVEGNQINVRGTGDSDPATPDYTLTPAGEFLSFPNSTDQHILVKGYNGRPFYQCSSGAAMLIYTAYGIDFQSMKLAANGTNNAQFGMLHARNNADNSNAIDCIIDQAGHQTRISQYYSFHFCKITNSGLKTTPTYADALYINTFGKGVQSCLIENIMGGVYLQSSAFCRDTIIANVEGYGIYSANSSHYYPVNITGNMIYGCSGNGIDISAENSVNNRVFHNVIVNAGGYGINNNSSVKNDHLVDRNVFYNNTSGNYNGYSGGDNDVILTGDPFVDSSAGDWNINDTSGAGATLRANNFSLNTDTSVYPFRQYVSDDFDSGAGGGSIFHPLAQ